MALIREKIALGVYGSGKHLSEIALSLNFGVPLNTLREVFRILIKEGRLMQNFLFNKGVIRQDAKRR